ncbi:MAG: glycosyltransferase family 4 protein [Ruminococcus sp.]|nr:glycosyltransferase family 4 protein [Ruminococcus sp.]
MKVLIISPVDLPVPAVRGGAVAELIESLMARHEVHRDFELTVISAACDDAAKKAAAVYPHTRMVFFDTSGAVKLCDNAVNGAMGLLRKRPRDFARKLSVIAQLRKFLLAEDFDKVVFQNSGYLLDALKDSRIADKFRGKLYFHVHNEIYKGTNFALLRQCRLMLISRYLLKNINRYSGMDFSAQSDMVTNGFDTDAFRQPFPEEERAALRSRLNIPADKKIVIYVGRLLPGKGVKEMIEGFQRACREDAVLLIVGSVNFGMADTSPYEAMIHRMLTALGDRAVATGFVHHDLINRYYRLADAAVLPTLVEEGAGLAMCEAVAAGVPLITTNSGGIPEYIDFDSAVLLERGENLPDEIALWLNRMLDDASWKQRAAVNAQLACEKFSEEVFYREFLEALQ